MERRREIDDEPRRRGRDDDRDTRGSDRGRDREPERGSRDRDEGRGRGDRDREPERSSRGRDEDRGSRGRDDREERGSSRGGGGYTYEPRSAESVRKRAQDDSKFDKLLVPGIPMFKINDSDNKVRILPPTWKSAEHWGLDIWVHYGVGPDRQSYLCPQKMKGEPCPICEEREKFVRTMDNDSKDDKEYAKELTPKQRTLLYVVDRNNERDGVVAWAMPHGLDMDITKISVDRDTGAVLQIDNPDDGYDLTFEKNGKGINTKYEGVSIARRESPLGKQAWLDFAVDKPLPDQLNYFDYDHIARAFGSGPAGGSGGRDADRDRDRDRDREREPSRDERDRDRDSRDRDRDPPRDERRREREPDPRDDRLTWEQVHSMKARELDDLVEVERLTKIDPTKAKDDEELADWICEDLGIKKPEAPARRRAEADDAPENRLADMRRRRSPD